MADREKLIEICFHEFCEVAGDSPCGCDGCPYGKYGSDNGECYEAYKKHKEEKLIANGVPVRERGRWHLEAHEENANFRWNVTAECPYCHSEKKEIWAGFFPGFPKTLAEYYSLESAKTVKLSSFCSNCGADMR